MRIKIAIAAGLVAFYAGIFLLLQGPYDVIGLFNEIFYEVVFPFGIVAIVATGIYMIFIYNNETQKDSK